MIMTILWDGGSNFRDLLRNVAAMCVPEQDNFQFAEQTSSESCVVLSTDIWPKHRLQS